MSLTTIEYKKLFNFPDRPLEIEIGFGSGRFLTARSQSNPNSNYLGIEPDVKSANDFIEDNKKSTNVKIILNESQYIIKNQIPDSYVNRYWLFNPEHYALYPTSKYIDEDFCDAIINTLEIDGIINIVTHYLWYSKELQNYFQKLKQVEPFVADERHQSTWEINNQAKENFIRMAFRKEV